jgi:hypothetical protein
MTLLGFSHERETATYGDDEGIIHAEDKLSRARSTTRTLRVVVVVILHKHRIGNRYGNGEQ